ncbi:hypothetical protein N657DRAFT_635892 [Parathielavia appendiculata]|uniref:Exonuclease domain-containing protein n=1 Tax=Parathielavia appendiculata TaxID=2587402 RepID=A0AAN6TV91_9PEZI|nr:hypothetical protein N657DRAFT_635892 [Parathielavia appendiculata]
MDAMEAVLRNFKLIPCPTGDSCTKANCPWQHPRDQIPASARDDGGSRDEDGPRKRRKVFSEPASTPVQLSSTKPEPASSKRPVSPPPLKRKAPQHPSQPALVSTPTKPSPISTVSSSTATKPEQNVTLPQVTRQPTTPQNVMPRKPETLNPRHLKTAAPAAHDFRYKALKLLHDQFQRLNEELKKDAKQDEQKFVLSAQELIWLALDEEQRMATEKPSIYQNVIKHRIMTYKRMTPGQWKDERVAEFRKKAAQATPGSRTPKKPVLGPPKVIQTGLTPQQEVKMLDYLRTPIESLSKWGYVPVAPSEEEITKAREGQEASLGWEVCDRCTTRFQVFPGRREEDGALTSGGKCVHHPGRLYYPERVLGDTDKPTRRYRCCQQVVGESPGCVSGSTHVFKTTSPARLAAVIPFAETPPNSLVPKDRAVCFDCEMGYTVRGLELIRLTATSWPDGKELLDVLVKPVGEILDLNSRFSGVWPEDIVNAEPWSPDKPNTTTQDETETQEDGYRATTAAAAAGDETDAAHGRKKKKKMQIVPSPVVARDLLFQLIAPETPLIGHGLENDLNAVRVIHPTLVDTILLYPHRRGLPMRYGLKMLMETQLNRAIQVEEVDGKATGHDSAEDARAAGELVRLKVMEKWRDMRAQGWRVLEEGEFVPPGGTAQTQAQSSGGGGKGPKGERRLSEAFLEEEDGELPST